MMKLWGVMEYANCLPWESRNPVILPRRHWVTTLIVKDAHESCQHGGTNQVLSIISTKYWIISAREEIRQWERECTWCHRRKAAPASQVMAPLPELRTRLSLCAFSHSGLRWSFHHQARSWKMSTKVLLVFIHMPSHKSHPSRVGI
jgi:hypothetical protein